MEFHGNKPGASMVMGHDEALKRLLREVIKDQRINFGIETGTYLGTGSTRFIAKAFCDVRRPRRFVTIEANYDHYRMAIANLFAFPFVECWWGRSVAVADALDFLANDDALRRHKEISGVWIDDVTDPLASYSAEVVGTDPTKAPYPNQWFGENLLHRLLMDFRDLNPLVVLDSAGGIGWLEFEILQKAMRDRPYVLLLDDTRHIKHFRTLDHIRRADDFTLLGAENDWALAIHHA